MPASACAVVTEDGSPHGPKAFVLWNPPLLQGTSTAASRVQWRHNKQAAQRRQRQEANQERGSGLHLGRDGLSQAEWLSAVKLSRRSAQLAAAVSQWPQQQPQQSAAAQEGEAEDVSPRQQHEGLQPPAQQPQQRPQEQAQQQAQQRAPLTPALRRAVEEARAALAAVGGNSSTKQPSRIELAGGTAEPMRPLIRREPVSSKAAVQKLAGASAGSSTVLPGGTAASRAEEVEEGAEDPRRRLPDSSNWRLRKASAAHNHMHRADGSGGSRQQQGGEGGSEAADSAADEDEAEERRSSPIVELSILLAECVQHGLRTIAFCKSRCV